MGTKQADPPTEKTNTDIQNTEGSGGHKQHYVNGERKRL